MSWSLLALTSLVIEASGPGVCPRESAVMVRNFVYLRPWALTYQSASLSAYFCAMPRLRCAKPLRTWRRRSAISEPPSRPAFSSCCQRQAVTRSGRHRTRGHFQRRSRRRSLAAAPGFPDSELISGGRLDCHRLAGNYGGRRAQRLPCRRGDFAR